MKKKERARSPGTAFPLWGPVLAKRRWAQLAAPSGPGPETLPSCHRWGSQVPRTQRALRLLRPPKQSGKGRSCRQHAVQVAEAGVGERVAATSRPGPGQWVSLTRALESCRTQPVTCPLGPLAHHLALATGWVDPLTVAHWRLATWAGIHWSTDQWLS